eukprot:2410572-Amphidinium_carterae.1
MDCSSKKRGRHIDRLKDHFVDNPLTTRSGCGKCRVCSPFVPGPDLQEAGWSGESSDQSNDEEPPGAGSDSGDVEGDRGGDKAFWRGIEARLQAAIGGDAEIDGGGRSCTLPRDGFVTMSVFVVRLPLSFLGRSCMTSVHGSVMTSIPWLSTPDMHLSGGTPSERRPCIDIRSILEQSLICVSGRSSEHGATGERWADGFHTWDELGNASWRASVPSPSE